MSARCPKNPKHKVFLTTAHEVHEWEVDPDGEFIKDLGCSMLAAKPDTGNIWICKICGSKAIQEN